MIVSLLNGNPAGDIGLDDRGLAYGDGVFRTLSMRAGVARDWSSHFAKLQHDCAALGLACPESAAWQGDLAMIATHAPDCVVKLLVTRGRANRGYQLPTHQAVTRIALAFAMPQYPHENLRDGVRARICRLRLSRQPRLAGIKHLNRLENVLARAEWDDPEISEGLLFDCDEQLVGGTMSNVFLLYGTNLATPDLAGAGVAGVQRARIIEVAGRLSVDVRIGCLSRDDLASADGILLCNSIFGIWGVRQLEERTFQPHPLVSRLRNELERAGD